MDQQSLQYIKDNYGLISYKEMGLFLHISPSTIKKVAIRNGIANKKSKNDSPWTKEEIQILIDKPTFVISKLHKEFPEAISFTSKLYEKIISGDNISTSDFIEFVRLVEFFSSIQAIDINLNSFTKNILELQNIQEILEKLVV
jgi:hypothetical protein